MSARQCEHVLMEPPVLIYLTIIGKIYASRVFPWLLHIKKVSKPPYHFRHQSDIIDDIVL